MKGGLDLVVAGGGSSDDCFFAGPQRRVYGVGSVHRTGTILVLQQACAHAAKEIAAAVMEVARTVC